MGQEFQTLRRQYTLLTVVMNTPTEIYGYGYEQGVDRVYSKGLKDRIAVTEKS